MSESRKEHVTQQPEAAPGEVEEAARTLVPATSAGMPPTAQAFWAVVNSDGTLARGFGAVATSRLALGQYQVTFSHDVSRSGFVAAQGFTGSLGVPADGTAVVVGRAGVPAAVFVATYNSAGALSDRAFHLAILA
ncbi:hypothetical protein [Plantactinospora sp. KBS50]|uniref:hypothetical protein n=1 Tax=Plantactinospora sp. KBS50 TaxID=2024580 RepID=UPI000BAB12EB|nr:hypothetical protein [Plantactinospora sp. KBS50]ASW53830.1 hypothetical protein CIK06_05975 [Plantactinospora sp. KBS50]